MKTYLLALTQGMIWFVGIQAMTVNLEASTKLEIKKNQVQQKLKTDNFKHKILAPGVKSKTRNALTREENLWPDGKVPFVFDTNVPAFSKLEVLAAMQEIEMSTYSGGKHCIMYVPRTTENDYVFISWTSDLHGEATIGRVGGRQSLTINSAGGRGHDDNLFSLLVTLGLVPEVMRTDRNAYLNINISNAQSREPFRMLSGEGSSTFGQPFDYKSIMLDSPYVHASDLAYPVVTAIEPLQVMGQSVSLTSQDATLIQHAYKCTVDGSNVVNLLGDMPLNCHFHEHVCSFKQDTDDDFDWVVQDGPTATEGTGPNADYSSGSGKFGLAEAAGHYGLVTRLISQDIPSGQYCLRIQVHLYGKDTGKLRITMKSTDGQDEGEVLHQNGPTPENSWYHLYATLNSLKDFNLNIEATIGDGDLGDIAIDDMFLYKGQCIEW